ncbi:MAG TPA: GTPase HflX [bacterium]|nr:GTPase HflX [bacterium]
MSSRVILIDTISPKVRKREAILRIEELKNLIYTYGDFDIVSIYQKKVSHPNYDYYIGKGKVEEVLKEVLDKDVDYIIINNELKPHQVWNLWELFEKIKAEYIKQHQLNNESYKSDIKRDKKIEIWDRIDLILKIFSKHATTKEAKLEIDLAKIRHMGPRIYRMGEMLSQEGGGIGTRGGGESNISMMRSHLKQEEQRLVREIEECQKTKELQKQDRVKRGLRTVAIVGYTNVGKSAILNALTNKNVYVDDKLFATLDTRIGNLYLPKINKICLVSDTIGFIEDLPPELINSFKSTLDETINADLILHIIDISDEMIDKKIKVVEDILKELNIKTKVIKVFNKIDLLNKEELEEKKNIIFTKFNKKDCLFISAKNKINIDKLIDRIEVEIK